MEVMNEQASIKNGKIQAQVASMLEDMGWAPNDDRSKGNRTIDRYFFLLYERNGGNDVPVQQKL